MRSRNILAALSTLSLDFDGLLTVLRVWVDDAAPLLCDIAFVALSTTLRGRLRRVADDGVLEFAFDGGVLVVTLRRDFVFMYADPRGYPDSEERFERGVVIGVRPGDRLGLFELKDPGA